MAKERDMTGLVKRGSVFWIRVRVPTDLVPALGQKERSFSLHTADRVEALNRHSVALSKLRAEFAIVRQQSRSRSIPSLQTASPKAIQPEEIKELVLSWFHQTEVNASKADREILADFNEAHLNELRGDLREDEATILGEIGPRHADTFDSDWARKTTDTLLSANGLALDPKSDSYAQLHRLIARGLIESIRRRQARLAGQSSTSTTDEFFSSILAENPPPEFSGSRSRRLLTVKQLADRFLADMPTLGFAAKHWSRIASLRIDLLKLSERSRFRRWAGKISFGFGTFCFAFRQTQGNVSLV